MKVYDCLMYYDEDTVLDIRLNCLDAYVDKFVIVESKFTHSGKKRNLLFDINQFKRFKDKIIYLVLDDEPQGIISIYDEDDENLKGFKYIENSLYIMIWRLLFHGSDTTSILVCVQKNRTFMFLSSK